MASRIVAQLLVAASTTVLRAATQAWQQALANAHKSGVAQEAVKQGAKAASAAGMSAQEARMILSVDPSASWVEVTKRYKHMSEVNQKYGSFYLQSKVYRAWEALDGEYSAEGRKTPEEEAAVQRLLHQDPSAAAADDGDAAAPGNGGEEQQQKEGAAGGKQQQQ